MIKVTLRTSAPLRVFGIDWQPKASAKMAAHNLFEGLGDWANAIVGFFIELPLYLLWMLSVGVLLWVAWIVVVRLWRVLRRMMPAPAKTNQA